MNASTPDNIKRFFPDQTIESRITATGAQLLDIIHGKLNYIGKAGTLVVNLGETHSNPFHIIAQTHLMHSLQTEHIPFVCALEREKNKTEIAMEQHTRIQNKQKAIEHLKKSDLLETYQTLAAIRTGSIHHAPLSHALQFDFMRQNKIPFHFIDAPRIISGSELVLDPKDPENISALEKASLILGEKTSTWQKIAHRFKMPDPIHLDSTKGTLARNISMLQACEDVRQSLQGTKLILLFTGAAHTRGNKASQAFSPIAHSLAHLSDEEKFDFIGVDLENDRSAQDFHLIKDKMVEYPTLSTSLFDMIDITNPENHTGVGSLYHLKNEERKVSALNLAWLAPYRGKMFDLYAQSIMDFEEISQDIQRLEK